MRGSYGRTGIGWLGEEKTQWTHKNVIVLRGAPVEEKQTFMWLQWAESGPRWTLERGSFQRSLGNLLNRSNCPNVGFLLLRGVSGMGSVATSEEVQGMPLSIGWGLGKDDPQGPF